MAKVMMETSVSIAANATNDNVLTGQRFERAPNDSLATFFSTGSAIGLTEEYNIGGRSASPSMPVNIQNRSPVVPDDLRIADVESYEGELIQVTVVNTTGGALTHRLRVELEDAEELFEEDI